MAPNIKSAGTISRHISLLDLSSLKHSHSFTALSRAVSDVDLQCCDLDEPEFLPLTSLDNEQQQKQPYQQEQKTTPNDYWGWDYENEETETKQWPVAETSPFASLKQLSTERESYWDWPSEETEEQIDVLSLSNIEANLIAESNRVKTQEAKNVSSHDDYWAENSSNPAEEKPTEAPLHVETSDAAYWDWSTPTAEESKDALIKKILRDEEARQALSVKFVEDNLVHVLTPNDTVQVKAIKPMNDVYWTWKSKGIAAHTMDSSNPKNSYWDWTEQEEEKSSLVASLLEYEEVRAMLCAEHIVRNLARKDVETTVEETKESSDDYWGWSEGLGDNYWDEAPQPTVLAAGDSYWDW